MLIYKLISRNCETRTRKGPELWNQFAPSFMFCVSLSSCMHAACVRSVPQHLVVYQGLAMGGMLDFWLLFSVVLCLW